MRIFHTISNFVWLCMEGDCEQTKILLHKNFYSEIFTNKNNANYVLASLYRLTCIINNVYIYRIVGKFGEVFNLATLRKIAKYCDIALCVCDRYRSSPN